MSIVPFLPSFSYSSAAPLFSLSFHDSICTPSVFSTCLRSSPLLAPILGRTPIRDIKMSPSEKVAGRLFTRDKIIQSHSVYPNSYVTSSYAARTMCRASAHDARVQFLKLLVKPCNVLLTNCGVSTSDCIYPVIPDPANSLLVTQGDSPMRMSPKLRSLLSIHHA